MNSNNDGDNEDEIALKQCYWQCNPGSVWNYMLKKSIIGQPKCSVFFWSINSNYRKKGFMPPQGYHCMYYELNFGNRTDSRKIYS